MGRCSLSSRASSALLRFLRRISRMFGVLLITLTRVTHGG